MMIKIASRIVQADADPQETTIFTEATYEKKQSKSFLMYEESELTGMAGTKTLLSYDGKLVTIKRFGNLKSTLRIEIGTGIDNRYQTPYGFMPMKTYGKIIKWEDAPKLHIQLVYELETEDGNKMEASIEIS